MYNLYKVFEKEELSLAYFGVFSDEITSMVIDLSESFLSKTENLGKLTKKTSFLIAESFQNIIRHSVLEKDRTTKVQDNKDFYQISIIHDKIIIASANIIEDKHINALNNHIEHINSLNSNQLKQLHLQVLANGSMSDKGGAGLGLIQIVRKSGLPLKKQFTRIDDQCSMLLLGLEISINKTVENNTKYLTSIERHYKKLIEHDILLLYKGDFSNASNSNIIEILNNNFVENGEILGGELKNIILIIEVMQNVSKHGKILNGIREGIFVISKSNNELYVECSNFVNQEQYEALKIRLEKIKSYTFEELDKEYKNTLGNSYLSDDGSGGLGLLEIARLTQNTFTFDFMETPEKEVFYSIKVKTS